MIGLRSILIVLLLTLTAGLTPPPFEIHEDSLHFRKDFLPDFSVIEHGKSITRLADGTKITYSIDPALQNRITSLFKQYHVPYGAFVALEPRTGKVLALVEHGRREPIESHLALRATYPAASIFKLVTAAAAVEEKKVTPETVIHYHGGLYRLGPKNWTDNPKLDRETITFSDALAKSCNVAFAKVALRAMAKW